METGTVVRSLMGRDKGYLLLVVNEDEKYVYVIDGKERPKERPKRKNKKHIESLAQLPKLSFDPEKGELRGNQALRKALNRLKVQLEEQESEEEENAEV